MKTMVKPLMAAAALVAIGLVPGCGGPQGPPPGGNTASAAGAAGSGNDTAGSGTGTGGNNPAQTPAAPGTSPPDTKKTASAVSNTVILGPQFVSITTISFKALPGQPETQSFELSNSSGQPVTVGSISVVPALVASPNPADIAAFTPDTECNDRTLDLGSSCTFTVTFRPTESRSYSAYLDLDIPSGEGFALEGHAEPAPDLGQDTSPPASQLAPSEPAPSEPASSEPAPAGGSSP